MATVKLIENVASALSRAAGDPVPARPPLPIDSGLSDTEGMITQFMNEIEKLSGEARRIQTGEIDIALHDLVQKYSIKKAAVWLDPKTTGYQLEEKLTRLGVEIAQNIFDKNELAACDLGVTTVDYAVPYTGTIGLLASPDKPKAVSLVPRVHLAIMTSSDLRPSLTSVFTEAKGSRYLTLISGPSRTSDIELILTLGVHGPKNLVVWIL